MSSLMCKCGLGISLFSFHKRGNHGARYFTLRDLLLGYSLVERRWVMQFTDYHRLGPQYWLYNLPAWRSWACWWTALSLCLLICRVGRISLSSKTCWGTKWKKRVYVTWKQLFICTLMTCSQKHGQYKKAQNCRGGRTGLGRQDLGNPSFKFFADARCEHREKFQKMGEGGAEEEEERREERQI